MNNRLKSALRPRWERVLTIGGLAVVLLLTGYALFRGRDTLTEYDWQVNVQLLVVSFLIYPGGLLLRLLGWHQVMSMLHPGLTLRTNAHIYCVTSLTRYVPGVIWYMVGRAELYKVAGASRTTVLAGSVVEAMLLVVTGLMTYLMSLPFSPFIATVNENLPSAMALVVVISGLLLLYPPILGGIMRFGLSRWGLGVTMGITGWKMVSTALTYVFAWLAGGLLLAVVASALVPIDLRLWPYLIGVWAAAGSVSILASFAMGGLGTKEVTLTLLLAPAMPVSVALVVALAFRVLTMLFEAVWVFVFALLLRETRPQRK